MFHATVNARRFHGLGKALAFQADRFHRLVLPCVHHPVTVCVRAAHPAAQGVAMVDWTKPVQTRDGRPARVLCTDASGPFPVVALVPIAPGSETARAFTVEGSDSGALWGHSDHDLVNVPERFDYFSNWYAAGPRIAGAHNTRDAADANAIDGRTAVLRITVDNGMPVAVDIEQVAR